MTSSCPVRAGEIGPIRREIVFEPRTRAGAARPDTRVSERAA
jgi:hypothetical protein